MTLNERIFDIATGEEVLKEYSKQQIAEVEIAKLEQEKRKAEQNKKAIEKMALLEKLGITEEEAKLLLG